jgi:hypothetical protein
MITSYNPYNDSQRVLYDKLFAEAFALLKEKNLLRSEDEDKTTLTSLEHYFSYIAELSTEDKKYLMIPLDENTEAMFHINANDRTITIPSQFSKCGAVQNDSMCEIAVFLIDRYFDYQDLNEYNIEVQWIAPNGKDENGKDKVKEGCIDVTAIKDITTYPGKIRFGWPIIGDMTKYDGAVQFAIRFWNGDRNSNTEATYIFNTIPGTLNVKKGLVVSNPESKRTMSLFDGIVKNSTSPSYRIPLAPIFGTPGQDLTFEEDYLVAQTEAGPIGALKDDTAIMTAQAYGESSATKLTYTWYRCPALKDGENEYVYDAKGKPVYGDPEVITSIEDEVTVGKVWVPVDVLDEDGNAKFSNYLQYGKSSDDGETIVPRLYGEEYDANYTYYLEKTQLEFVAGSGADVIGQYYVEAVTEALDQDGDVIVPNSEYPKSYSQYCTLLAPKPIVITTNLPKRRFIEDNNVLSVAVKEDGATYQWQKKELNGTYTDIADATDASYTIEENGIGWYKVKIASDLNRVNLNKESEECMVTKYPTAPESKVQRCLIIEDFEEDITKTKILAFINGDNNVGYDWILESSEAPESHNIDTGDYVLMDCMIESMNTLTSDEISYKWKYQKNGSKWVDFDMSKLSKEFNGDGKIDEDLMTAIKAKNMVLVQLNTTDTVYNFACDVTNTINGKTATAEAVNSFVFN